MILHKKNYFFKNVLNVALNLSFTDFILVLLLPMQFSKPTQAPFEAYTYIEWAISWLFYKKVIQKAMLLLTFKVKKAIRNQK